MNKSFWEVCGDHPVLTFFVVGFAVDALVGVAKAVSSTIVGVTKAIKGIPEEEKHEQTNKVD